MTYRGTFSLLIFVSGQINYQVFQRTSVFYGNQFEPITVRRYHVSIFFESFSSTFHNKKERVEALLTGTAYRNMDMVGHKFK